MGKGGGMEKRGLCILLKEKTVVQNPTGVEQDLEQQPSQGETDIL